MRRRESNRQYAVVSYLESLIVDHRIHVTQNFKE